MLAIAALRALAGTRSECGRRISVRWRCGDAVADVDPLRVSQALDNLIANALEHGGGPITLEGIRHGDRIDLVVRDTGGVQAGAFASTPTLAAATASASPAGSRARTGRAPRSRPRARRDRRRARPSARARATGAMGSPHRR